MGAIARKASSASIKPGHVSYRIDRQEFQGKRKEDVLLKGRRRRIHPESFIADLRVWIGRNER
jgi:hypothetical protein